MEVVRRLSLALTIGLLLSMPLGAQNPVPPTGTITGRVVDAATQQPVADVSVAVDGTRRGAVSGADGTFTIGGVPSGSQTVRARRIGFAAPVQIVAVPNGGLFSSLGRRFCRKSSPLVTELSGDSLSPARSPRSMPTRQGSRFR
jgi:hypothetical protein